jgi:hypothetical protein
MSYTQIDDERIDQKIDEAVDIIREEILKVIKPVSIILFGGYGRGEGSAEISGDKITLSRDYDTLLIVKKKLSPSVIYRMSENIHRRLGRTNPLDSMTCEFGSGVSFGHHTLDELLYFRDVKTYEIKVASKLLWGEDIRKKIPVKREDLSPWNGLRFLLRRPPGTCACFSVKYLKTPPVGEEKEILVNECARIYLDGGVLLTLLMKDYRPSFRERSKVITESLASSLPDLANQIPDLAEKLAFFTQMKLFPDRKKIHAMDVVKLWFQTRKDLGIILRYFMEHHLGEKAMGWAELFDKYNTRMNREFVDELAYFYLKKRFKVASKPLARLANLAYQRLFCLKYTAKLHKLENIFYWRALTEFPTFKVNTCALMLYFSLNEDGTLDRELFNSYVKSLSRIYPVKIKGSTDEEMWKEGVDYCVKADRTFLDTYYEWG